VSTLSRSRLAREAKSLNRQAPHLPPLVLMTDDQRLPDPIAAAKDLPRGSMVIIRAQQSSHRAKLAVALQPIARAREIMLVIANDPLLANRLRVHGVHFSEGRAREAARWRARRPKWLITAAAHSLRSCQIARSARADMAFLAPVFPTLSHLDGRQLGPARARFMARHARLPVYALGGISAQNSALVWGAFAGIAAIGALIP